MSSVCGRRMRGEPAALMGYVRHPVADQDYPGIRPNPNARVQGILYRDLGAVEIARLDDFEGIQYDRRPVGVSLPGGEQIDAETYVFGDAYQHLLRPGEWDFARFLEHGKARFVGRYVGFQRLPSTTPNRSGEP